MIDNPEKKILIIAGPNGAGKTTFANEFLPNEANCPVFIKMPLNFSQHPLTAMVSKAKAVSPR